MISDVALPEKTVLETKRFKIRPLNLKDIIKVEMYVRDIRLARSSGTIPHPLTPDFVKDFIEKSMSDETSLDAWGIEVEESGSTNLIGVVSLNRLDRSQSEIAYWVIPAIWNTGVATEAVKAFIEVNPQNCKTIFGSVFQDNPASSRVLTNAGFEYIGEAESLSVARSAMVATWTYIKKLD
jgi:RimJ/RimL family protein N-acetyltransferase